MLQEYDELFVRINAIFDAKKVPKLKIALRQSVNNIANLSNILLRKSLLKENLYNYSEEMAHDFYLPEEKEIFEKDKARIIYDRLRAYVNALEYLANSIPAEFDEISLEFIKNCQKILSYFSFYNYSSQANINTKILKEMTDKLLAVNDQILKRVVVDNLKLLEDSFKKMKVIIDEIVDFKKEKYRVLIRYKIFPFLKEGFSDKLLKENPQEYIVKLQKVMEKETPEIPFNKEWIFESIKSCYSVGEKEAFERVKSIYSAADAKSGGSAVVAMLPREKLISIIEYIASSNIILEKIYIILDQNLKFVQKRKKSFFEEFLSGFKKAVNAQSEDEFFHIEYINPSTKEIQTDTVKIYDFMLSIKKKIMLLSEITRKDSKSYEKIKMGKEEALYKFLESTYLDLILCKERILGINSEIRLKVSRRSRQDLKELEEPLEKLDDILKKTQELRRKYVGEQEALVKAKNHH